MASAKTFGDWSYNANNELEGYDDVTFQFDANGNVTEKNAGGAVTKFFYNLEDRMERVEDGSGNVIATYYYDPFGRRLWKDLGGIRTYFLYSDKGLVGEYDAGGGEIKTYGWKPTSTWSTDPLFVKVAAEYYWYHNDYLGTPQIINDISGAVVWKAALSSFGKSEPKMSFSVVNPFRFAGQYYDAETEFHYNWNRYYDPELGMYLRRDPILNEEVSGLSFIKSNLKIPANFNSYLYSIQNPLRYSDSTGLACGPGWLGDIIVDDYKFGSCCQKHDDCDSGKPGYRCKKRKDCDNDFCQCMNETCEKVSDRGYCRTKARQYCGAVKRHGASHYFIRSCDCPATGPKTKK